jgi:hypothetical protein
VFSVDFGCPKSYGGAYCIDPICFGKLRSDATVCGGNGVCVAPDTCVCNEGNQGVTCTRQKIPVDVVTVYASSNISFYDVILGNNNNLYACSNTELYEIGSQMSSVLLLSVFNSDCSNLVLAQDYIYGITNNSIFRYSISLKNYSVIVGTGENSRIVCINIIPAYVLTITHVGWFWNKCTIEESCSNADIKRF